MTTPEVTVFVSHSTNDGQFMLTVHEDGCPYLGLAARRAGTVVRSGGAGKGMSSVITFPVPAPMPTTADDIVCREWCVISKQEHLDLLMSDRTGNRSAEMDVRHNSAPGESACVGMWRCWDGRPEKGDAVPSVWIMDHYLTAEEAEGVIEDLRAAIAVLRP